MSRENEVSQDIDSANNTRIIKTFVDMLSKATTNLRGAKPSLDISDGPVKDEEGSESPFLNPYYDDMPPGLVDNPGKAIGVQLKKGEKVKVQRANHDNTIIDGNEKKIYLMELKPQNIIFSKRTISLSVRMDYLSLKLPHAQ